MASFFLPAPRHTYEPFLVSHASLRGTQSCSHFWYRKFILTCPNITQHSKRSMRQTTIHYGVRRDTSRFIDRLTNAPENQIQVSVPRSWVFLCYLGNHRLDRANRALHTVSLRMSWSAKAWTETNALKKLSGKITKEIWCSVHCDLCRETCMLPKSKHSFTAIFSSN